MRKFEIQTLSDRVPMQRRYSRLSDPVSILTGSMALLTQIFPSIFNTRTPMTKEFLNNVFPGNGYWTVLLKNFLKEHTQWTVDARFWYPFENQQGYIKDFAYINRNLYAPDCNGVFSGCAWEKFQQILKQEQMSGGNLPSGQFPGGMYSGTMDWQTLALIGGGAVLLITLMNRKKRKK